MKRCEICNGTVQCGRRKYCQYCNIRLRRVRVKLAAIRYKGGECERCGYREIGALQFHHKDPEEKDFQIGSGGTMRTWKRVRAEIDKCSLLCANCHAIEHSKIDAELLARALDYQGSLDIGVKDVEEILARVTPPPDTRSKG